MKNKKELSTPELISIIVGFVMILIGLGSIHAGLPFILIGLLIILAILQTDD